MLSRCLVAFLLAASVAGLATGPVTAQDRSITVFAAASMKNALDDVNAAFTARTGIKVVVSYAASSALMKQIEQGAPADVFVSADLDWMDYGSQKKVIKDDTRTNLLGNKLVLIAPKDSKIGTVTAHISSSPLSVSTLSMKTLRKRLPGLLMSRSCSQF